MSIDVRLPQYGMGMQEGTIVQWFKKEGDRVEAGEVLAEVEAEKSTEELTAQDSGVIEEIVVPEGATAPVNEVLARLSPAGGGGASKGEAPREARAGGEVPPAPKATAKEAVGVERTEDAQVVPLTSMRATIAQRMQASLQTSAQLTLVKTADVTDLVAYRNGIEEPLRPTYTDMVVRAAAIALGRHPGVNSVLEEDGIHLLPDIHVGIAIDVPGGLVVPVVRHADRKSLQQITIEAAELVARARAGELRVEDLTGATFTVTSLGGQGVDAFTPIINPPQAAILGAGRIVEQPARGTDGGLVWRQMITLSLTIDHRLVDGAPGAAFLATVAGVLGDLETPSG